MDMSEREPTEQIGATLALLMILIRELDQRGVLRIETARDAYRRAFESIPEDQRDLPKHHPLLLLLQHLEKDEQPDVPAWFQGVIDGGLEEDPQ